MDIEERGVKVTPCSIAILRAGRSPPVIVRTKHALFIFERRVVAFGDINDAVLREIQLPDGTCISAGETK